MSKQPETLFKEKVLPLLRPLPFSWWIKLQLVALLGMPDILGCVRGRFIALELKKGKTKASAKGKASRLQGHVLGLIRAAGGYTAVVSPENWQEIYKLMEDAAHGRHPLP